MANIQALVVESDFNSTVAIGDYLTQHNIDVDFAYNGISAFELIFKNEYDIIIADTDIKKLDALSLCHKLRQQMFSSIPIILISQHIALDLKVNAFNAGADDYLIKPFVMQELYLRILAITKRGPLRGIGKQRIADLDIDFNASTVSRGEQMIKLHQVQMNIVRVLAHHYPNTVSRQMLEQEIWAGALPESSPLRTHIYRLRQLLNKSFERDIISTVYARGYKIAMPT